MTSSLNILIVDDSTDDLEFYSDLLSNCKTKYNVFTTDSVDEGIKIFDQNDIDCTFIDYNMPGKDGVEVLNILSRKSNRDLAIVILTGEPKKKVKAEAARKGALDYIVKNSHNSPEQLEEVIQKVIKWAKS